MIDLNGITTHESPIQEAGGILDATFNALDINANQIKQDWENSAKGIDDKLASVNNNGVKKVRDVADTIQNGVLSKQTVDTRSIIARARNSVLQFPIYITQTLRVNEAQIIAKMFERVYTTLVQAVLAQNVIVNEEDLNNLVFLKQFHTNISEATDFFVNNYYEPIDEIDHMMSESMFYTQKLTDECIVEFRVVPTTDQDLIIENARLMNEPLTGFLYLKEAVATPSVSKDEYSKNDDPTRKTTIEKTNKNVTVSEKELEEMAKEQASLTGEEKRLLDMSYAEIKNKAENENLDASKGEINIAITNMLNDKKKAENKVDIALEKIKKDIKSNAKGKYGIQFVNGKFIRSEMSVKTQNTEKPKEQIRPAADLPKLLRDSDIKKINGLLPYTMEVTFRVKLKNGTLDRDVKYIIGVKSVMHLIRTQDLAEDLRELVTGKIKSLQKVRYKTGEIGFMDYMFNVKNIKKDAAKHINYNKRWLNTLKRLSEYDRINGSYLKTPAKLLTNGAPPIPNGTLVLSQPDVTTLMNQTGIDLSIVSNAKRLAKNLFLIAIVIVDSSAGSMRVLFPDSDNNWDVQSLASIDAEVSKTDNSQLMKELNQMVNKR